MIDVIFLIPIMIFGAALFNAAPNHKDSIEIVRACTAEQVDLCGDILCEAGYEDEWDAIEGTIKGHGNLIQACLESPENISPQYFDQEFQKELLGDFF